MIRRRVVVRGRVQGVLFRDATRRMAEARGVSGWARNRPDGAVEAAFEGDPDAVEEMVRFCGGGPARAEVESIEVTDEEPVGEQGFRVL
jgi:acylphosphatase